LSLHQIKLSVQKRQSTVYNINPGMNEALQEASQTLKEYVLFTTKIRENRKNMALRDAVNRAVEDCINEGILAEFLASQRAEVVAMSIFEYDAEKHIRLEKEESYEDGKAEGRTEGKAESILIILKEKGELSKETERRIIEERNSEVLKRWVLLATSSDDIKTFKRGM